VSQQLIFYFLALFIILKPEHKPRYSDCRVAVILWGVTCLSLQPTHPPNLRRVRFSHPFSLFLYVCLVPCMICLSLSVFYSDLFNILLPFVCLPPFSISGDEVSFKDNTYCLLLSSWFGIYLFHFCYVQTGPYGNPGISPVLLSMYFSFYMSQKSLW
jgi:hypothetical protein